MRWLLDEIELLNKSCILFFVFTLVAYSREDTYAVCAVELCLIKKFT